MPRRSLLGMCARGFRRRDRPSYATAQEALRRADGSQNGAWHL